MGVAGVPPGPRCAFPKLRWWKKPATGHCQGWALVLVARPRPASSPAGGPDGVTGVRAWPSLHDRPREHRLAEGGGRGRARPCPSPRGLIWRPMGQPCAGCCRGSAPALVARPDSGNNGSRTRGGVAGVPPGPRCALPTIESEDYLLRGVTEVRYCPRCAWFGTLLHYAPAWCRCRVQPWPSLSEQARPGLRPAHARRCQVRPRSSLRGHGPVHQRPVGVLALPGSPRPSLRGR